MEKFAHEYSEKQNHTIVSKNTIKGDYMEQGYIQYETMQDGMKVILEVPEQSEKDEKAKQEIRKILTTVLQEYLQTVS